MSEEKKEGFFDKMKDSLSHAWDKTKNKFKDAEEKIEANAQKSKETLNENLADAEKANDAQKKLDDL